MMYDLVLYVISSHRIEIVAQGRAKSKSSGRPLSTTYTHASTMSAVAQVQQVAKTVAVSTGKVANAKSMMIWRPHGNKYVSRKIKAHARGCVLAITRASRPWVYPRLARASSL